MRSREFWLLWLQSNEVERLKLLEKYVVHFVQGCCALQDRKLRKHCVASALKSLLEDLEEALRNEGAE